MMGWIARFAGVSILAMSLYASAQKTAAQPDATAKAKITGWSNIRFGMTKDEIRSLYKDDIMQEEPFLLSIGSYDRKTASLPAGVCTVLCEFTTDSKCWRISISFCNTSMDSLAKDLARKYGAKQVVRNGSHLFFRGSHDIYLWRYDGEKEEEMLLHIRNHIYPEAEEIDVVSYTDNSLAPKPNTDRKKPPL